LASVGNDFDFSNDDIGALGGAFELGFEGKFEFADALRLDGELRTFDAIVFDGEVLF
jgi:hypothetical protein